VRLRVNINLCLLLAALTLPSTAFSQVFLSQGPAPGFGPLPLSISADQPPSGPGLPRNGTLANAINAVAPDPSDPNTLYVGAVNGGVWVTHNGGTTWTPLTDNQVSLSISSLTLDPTDPTHKTLIAGAGLTSAGSVAPGAGFFLNSGGLRTGLLVSTDGGNTWAQPAGNPTVAGVTIVNVQARGPLILAAGFEPLATAPANDRVAAQNGALYRSTDGGRTFTVGAAGLAPGPVSSLVGDPSNLAKFYAAVTSTTVPNATSLYVSADSGASWSPNQCHFGDRGQCDRLGHQSGVRARVRWTAGLGGDDRHRRQHRQDQCALFVAQFRTDVVETRSALGSQ
jgi:photosystem II stability/assembly factor-like uncharacterized protein